MSMAERVGFEPTTQFITMYPLSRRAPSTNSAISPGLKQQLFINISFSQKINKVANVIILARTANVNSNSILMFLQLLPVLLISQIYFQFCQIS